MDPRIAWARVELERRLHERVTVAMLARGIRLSPGRFAHLFRAEVGAAPLQFLRALRLDRARVLLERTFLSVTEVMALVGYADPSHFTRDFRRAHGFTPTELRQRGWVGCQRHDGDGTAPGRPGRVSRPKVR